MGVVLPGEADAAVQLDGLGSGGAQGFETLREGEPTGPLAALAVPVAPVAPTAGIRRPRRVVRRRPGRLHPYVHIGEPVLHGLEGADRAPELLALLDVGDGAGERAVGGADGLGGEQDGDALAGPGQRGPHVRTRARFRLPQQLTLHVPQFEPGARPGLVKRGLPDAYETGGVTAYEEEQRTRPGETAGVRGDEEQLRAVAVEDLVDLSVEAPDAVGRPRLHAARAAAARPVVAVRRVVAIVFVVADEAEGGGECGAGDGEGGGQLAGGDAGQQLGVAAGGAEGEQQGRGEPGGGDER
ncbi:hypothetical protein SMD44_03690 [Streptomyces alboflavus]|uniref:Uncharacterized protein n=1 Tax=Streptomyces alboflavus TaxID=67267 RepID=A0A1Z1WD28_9ACTN|nr:hypothetical protein SMD44_03690 [Streptomyces alboflavus]